jgi:hypothetical protein
VGENAEKPQGRAVRHFGSKDKQNVWVQAKKTKDSCRTYSLKVVEGSRRVIPECRHVHDQVQPEVSRPKQGKSKRKIINKELIQLLLDTVKAFPASFAEKSDH